MNLSICSRLFSLLFVVMALSAAERPNFLIIYADDLGYGDVSTYHTSDVQTPHIDALAREGMLFTRMRANCTVCSPSRAALLTGRYPDRAGVPGVIRTDPKSSWGYFNPDIPTIADLLRDHGYSTAIIGKWHLGLTSPNLPNERGFTFFKGFLGDMMDSYITHRRGGINFMRENDKEIDPPGHATDIFSTWAIEYITQQAKQKTQPFFLYLAYNAPHFPIQPPAEYIERVKKRAPGLDKKRCANVAFVEHLDDRIGDVLEALRVSGLAENTVVVITSDNGGSLPHAQNNDPWRDGKQSHFDGGIRVPFMMRWPGTIKAGSQSDYAGLTFDIFSTFLGIAGVAVPSGTDAVDLRPLYAGGSLPNDRVMYFVRREGGSKYKGKDYHAVIKGDWKILQNDPFMPFQLYNVATDPGEEKDLASKHPAEMRELEVILRAHIQKGGQVPWQSP